MIVNFKELIVLSPILVIIITIVIVLLSISYRRNQFLHAGVTICGLCVSIVFLIVVWCFYNNVYSIFQLICFDNFSVFCTMLTLISSLLSGTLAYNWLFRYPNDRTDEFYLLLLISSIGGVLLVTTNHLVILFLGMELLSLPLFGLVGYSFFKKYSLEASIKYVVLSGVSSSFLLLGMSLVYAETGCLMFTAINQSLLLLQSSSWLYRPILVVGLCIMMVGFGVKLSFVPFHFWVPDIYQGTSYPVLMYLTNSIKIAVISVLIRFFLIIPDQYNEIFHILLSISACCSIIFGNLMATQQNSIKRILAYASIAHTGYLLVGLITLKEDSSIVLEFIGIYLINYLISSIGIFSIVGIISKKYYTDNEDADSIFAYRGLFWKHPILSIFFTIILLSFAGVPMTLGFISKFYLFMLGIGNQLWWTVIFMGIGSIIGMFYYLKIVASLYVRPVRSICSYSFSAISTNWICTIEGMMVILFTFFILFLGLYPQFIMRYLCFFLD